MNNEHKRSGLEDWTQGRIVDGPKPLPSSRELAERIRCDYTFQYGYSESPVGFHTDAVIELLEAYVDVRVAEEKRDQHLSECACAMYPNHLGCPRYASLDSALAAARERWETRK